MEKDFGIMKQKDYIPVSKPYLPSEDKIIKYIKEIYKARFLTNFGKFHDLLEEKLKQYLHIPNIVLTANGTLALQITYKLLDIKGIVITTPFTFVATISSLAWEGIPFIFADIDKETLCIDPNQVEYLLKKFGDKVDAILAVHVFGNPAYVEELMFLKAKYNVKLIFDASHCFSVWYGNRNILTYGDISIISFHATKLFHTVEGGGLIINNGNDELVKKAKSIVNFGIERDYKISCVGINAKMNEFEAAIGLAILEEFNEVIKLRGEKWNYYYQNLKNIVKLQKRNRFANNNYSYFPIILPSETQVLDTIDRLKRFGIYPKRYFYPSLDKLPYITKENIPLRLDNANYIAERILCLPLYPDLSKQTQDIIISTIKEVLESA